MNPLSPSARLLLDRYKASQTLPASSKTRLLSNVMQAVARGDRPRMDFPRAAASAEHSWLGIAWNQRSGKAMIAAVLALPALALGAFASRPDPLPRPAVSVALVSHPSVTALTAQPAIAPASAAAVPSESAAPRPLPPQKSIASKGVRSAMARPAAEPTIDGEMRLLNQAQAANLASDSRRALALLDEYAQRFPSGRLNDVSSVARLIALCNLGQTSLARREAERFQARYPKSPFKERVSRICAPKAVP